MIDLGIKRLMRLAKEGKKTGIDFYKRLKKGDEKTWQEFVLENCREIYKFAYANCKDKNVSARLTQETFKDFLENIRINEVCRYTPQELLIKLLRGRLDKRVKTRKVLTRGGAGVASIAFPQLAHDIRIPKALVEKVVKLYKDFMAKLLTPSFSISNVTDPFDVTSSFADQIEFKDYKRLYDLLEKRYGEWIDREFKQTGAKTLVLCNHKVVAKSDTYYGPSDEELKEIEAKEGKICFVKTRLTDIEEAGVSLWTQTQTMVKDKYPTVPLYLGKEKWGDEEVFGKNKRIEADFDTGNPDLLAFNARFLREPPLQEILPPRFPRELEFPLMAETRRFYSFGRRIKIGVLDVNRNKRCRVFDVLFITNVDRNGNPTMDWKNTDFTRINPNREGFVGRSLMYKFRLSITLDPISQKSTIRLME